MGFSNLRELVDSESSGAGRFRGRRVRREGLAGEEEKEEDNGMGIGERRALTDGYRAGEGRR